MRKILLCMIILVIAMGVSACSPPPKDILENALVKSADIKSYSFNTNAALQLDLKEIPADPMAGQIMSMLGNVEITAEGKADNDAKKLEMNLKLALKGDMSMEINIPIMLDNEMLYVKIPNIPFFPLPAEMVNKFIEIDLKELQEQQLDESYTEPDMELVRNFTKDFVQIISEDFGDTQFLTKLTGDDNIPSDFEADHVIQIRITDEDLEEVVTIVVEKTMPKMFELFEKEEYKELFDLAEEDLAEVKKGLDEAELTEENFQELRNAITLHETKMMFGITDNYLTKQRFFIDLEVKEDGNARIKLDVSSNLSDINQEQQYELSKPSSSDIITLEDIEKLFSGF